MKDNFTVLLKRDIESDNFSLPIFDAVSVRILIELVKKEPNVHTVEKLILADQSLSSNLLKIANSARYGGIVKVTTVKTAIVKLGMSEVLKVTSMDINKKVFGSRDPQVNAIMKKLWQHSLGCAFAAGLLSEILDFGVMKKEAFFAGLFHDIGKLLILKVFAEKKRKNNSIKVPDELLLEAMDILHTKQGFLLMEQLHMPRIFGIVARDHHLHTFDRHNYLLILTRMANHICHFMGIGLIIQDPSVELSETEEAVFLKLSETNLETLKDYLNSAPFLA
jgi:HD-like signal output (HDOD) protein